MPYPLIALPNEFFLYNATRTHTNSLVLLQSVTGAVYYEAKLTVLPFTDTLAYKVKFDKIKPESTPYGNYRLQGLNNFFCPKQFFAMKDIHVTSPTGTEIPVLRFTEPAKHIHGSTALNRNFLISKFEGPPAVAAVAVAESNTYSDINGAAPGNSIQINSLLNAKTKITPSKPKGSLRPFVAKQLMELAQSKHEFCPILAEEFSAGHTAVMPCGHLFASVGLTESFKKEPNSCPTCRRSGLPTYV